MSITQAVVPKNWKCARVIPLFNSGEKGEMDNYRPISILPAISKVAEKVVYHQLYLYLTEIVFYHRFNQDFAKVL